MTLINSYLTFNGNCREAMQFYQECLGGELRFQTIGESPLSDRMPQKMKVCILHATLTRDQMVLMGSDMINDSGLIKGNAISMVLNCSDEDEIRRCYKSLASGGTADHPLEESFWGALFGDLTDQYGNHWLLSFEKNNTSSDNQKTNNKNEKK